VIHLESEAVIHLTVTTSPGSGAWLDLEDDVVDEELIGLRLGVLLPVIYCEKYVLYRRS